MIARLTGIPVEVVVAFVPWTVPVRSVTPVEFVRELVVNMPANCFVRLVVVLHRPSDKASELIVLPRATLPVVVRNCTVLLAIVPSVLPLLSSLGPVELISTNVLRTLVVDRWICKFLPATAAESAPVRLAN